MNLSEYDVESVGNVIESGWDLGESGGNIVGILGGGLSGNSLESDGICLDMV